jgi:hypothetical protein
MPKLAPERDLSYRSVTAEVMASADAPAGLTAIPAGLRPSFVRPEPGFRPVPEHDSMIWVHDPPYLRVRYPDHGEASPGRGISGHGGAGEAERESAAGRRPAGAVGGGVSETQARRPDGCYVCLDLGTIASEDLCSEGGHSSGRLSEAP